MDLLDKAAENYLDELSGLLPLHRFGLFLLAIPPVLATLDQKPIGVFLSYFAYTPDHVFSTGSGGLWQTLWAGLLLIITVVFVSCKASQLIRRNLFSALASSPNKKTYLLKMEAFAETIRQRHANTGAIETSLWEKYEARKKNLLNGTKLAEFLISFSILTLVFCSRWDVEDIGLSVLLLSVGLTVELKTARLYISKVAPIYLLYGHLTGKLFQFEDGYYP